MQSHDFSCLNKEITEHTETKLAFMHGGCTPEIIPTIFSKLASNPSLKTLEISYHDPLSTETVRLLSNAIQSNQTLEVLHLNNNKIDDDGAHYLAEALSKHPSIHSIDLSHNCFSEKGMRYFADALKHNTTWIFLQFWHNEKSLDSSIECLSESLATNTTLKILNLSQTNITNESIQHLVCALKKNYTLSSLNLSLNKVTNVGAQQFITLQEENRAGAPIKIDLNANTIDQIHLDTLSTLATISIREQRIAFELLRAMAQQSSFFFTLPVELLEKIYAMSIEKDTLPKTQHPLQAFSFLRSIQCRMPERFQLAEQPVLKKN